MYITDKDYYPNIEIMSIARCVESGNWYITQAINMDTDKLYTAEELERINYFYPYLANELANGALDNEF